MTDLQLLASLLDVRNGIIAMKNPDEDLESVIEVMESQSSPGDPCIRISATPRFTLAQGAAVQALVDAENFDPAIEFVIVCE